MKSKIFFLISFLVLPVIVFGQDKGIVPCDGSIEKPCDFNQLVALGNSVISFLIKVGASLGAVSFAWAGWLYITSGGNPGTIAKAKDIFWKVILGFVLMLAAWLIIKLTLASLGYEGTGIGFIDGLVRK